MRVVTLEEHVSLPELLAMLPKAEHHEDGFPENISKKLADIDRERIRSMNDSGITTQVISVIGAGAQLLPADKAPAFAARYNDVVAKKISPYPDRFAAFAHLPMLNPDAAAAELGRTVKEFGFKGALINGLANGEFLDHERYRPVLEKAVALDVPLYLHPAPPPKAVSNAYYGNLPKSSGSMLSMAGWGWHSETAIHILRLIVSGTLDHHPTLKIIIGHMGEMLPVMMARCDDRFGVNESGINKRSISETLRNQVYITTSGIFTLPPFRAAMETFGIDRILFSVDYPFSENIEGKRFLDSLSLNAVDMEKLAHGNADMLLQLCE